MITKKIKIFPFFLFVFYSILCYCQPIKTIDKSDIKVKTVGDIKPIRNATETEKTYHTENTESTEIIINTDCHNPVSKTYTEKYKLINTYIPTKDEDIKYININFNIFQDFEGNNNFQPSINAKDVERLNNMFLWVNEIYAKQPWCEATQTYNSDPPPDVTVNDLPHKFIQFKLNGIYEYRDKTPGEGLWKSNNSAHLINRIAETDSNRLKQLNICFTEKYYLGNVREIIIVDKGIDYEHPEVIIKDRKGKAALAYASVSEGKIKSIDVLNGGSNYSNNTRIIINGGGKDAVAKAIINENNGSIQKIEVIDGGNNYKFTRIEIKGAGGAGALAYITQIKKGKINNVYVQQKGFSYYDDPSVNIITDSKGNGAVLKPVLRGATGFTLTPSFIDAQMFIVEKNLWNKGKSDGDYAAATNIAHELGHVLDLLHTYNSGGTETNNPTHHNYMPDLFGSSFSGYDIINWGKDPCESPNDKVTNNLMGGNQISQYTSPMQIGKMHRALNLYNIKKYTDCNCDTKKVWSIDKNEVWDFSFKSYNPILIKKGASLFINCTLEMPDGCDIVVEKGGSLVIAETGLLTGGCNKAWNGKLIIRNGAQFTVEPGGKYFLEDLSKLIIE